MPHDNQAQIDSGPFSRRTSICFVWCSSKVPTESRELSGSLGLAPLSCAYKPNDPLKLTGSDPPQPQLVCPKLRGTFDPSTPKAIHIEAISEAAF
jgi:hypothetical protein